MQINVTTQLWYVQFDKMSDFYSAFYACLILGILTKLQYKKINVEMMYIHSKLYSFKTLKLIFSK